ncbi:Shedu immune nuclease family protein [Nocardia sp. NPDC056100]|uniref:Shedu immune nuclease family protein n=1 Tax=Nocardia sp. NPDC056100 TaxID=3345712 RepID=UPI0035DF8694
MARIRDLSPNKQRITAHSLDKSVVCEHQAVEDADGAQLLHLSTFGSKDRVSHPKSSQSLQFDAKIAAQLTQVFRDTFGDEELGIQTRWDLAFPTGVTLDPSILTNAYNKNPDLFRELIGNDEAADDVVAMARRRNQVALFKGLLTDPDFFARAVEETSSESPEAVWQRFFEDNAWIFGVSLSGQFLTEWSDEKLEQVVVGNSIGGVGKRADALMRTSGRIKSMVFAEIKTHQTKLLRKDPYRPGCWAPSSEVSGAVAQVQGTIHRTVDQIGRRLQEKASDGSDVPGDYTYLLRPRSYLIVGDLTSLHGESGGVHEDRFRSFELFRRNLTEPEILTFDELLARAEWMVSTSAVPDSNATKLDKSEEGLALS